MWIAFVCINDHVNIHTTTNRVTIACSNKSIGSREMQYCRTCKSWNMHTEVSNVMAGEAGHKFICDLVWTSKHARATARMFTS